MKFLAWVLSLFFAFNLGAQTEKNPSLSDSELQDRVQKHLDVIVDESAAIVDEVAGEIRNDPLVKDAEKFVQDVQEVAEETMDELNQVVENTKERVQDKFGPKEEPSVQDPAPAAVPEGGPGPAPEDAPAPHEPVNG